MPFHSLVFLALIMPCHPLLDLVFQYYHTLLASSMTCSRFCYKIPYLKTKLDSVPDQLIVHETLLQVMKSTNTQLTHEQSIMYVYNFQFFSIDSYFNYIFYTTSNFNFNLVTHRQTYSLVAPSL